MYGNYPVTNNFIYFHEFQVMTERFGFMNDAHPLLAVRLAESVMGRVGILKLSIIIPAHFLGCLLGAAIFYTLCPFNYYEVWFLLIQGSYLFYIFDVCRYSCRSIIRGPFLLRCLCLRFYSQRCTPWRF